MQKEDSSTCSHASRFALLHCSNSSIMFLHHWPQCVVSWRCSICRNDENRFTQSTFSNNIRSGAENQDGVTTNTQFGVLVFTCC